MNPEIIAIINRYFTMLENNRSLHQRVVTANFAHEQNMYNLINTLVNNPRNHRFPSRTRLSPLNNRSRENISLFNLYNLFQDVVIRPSEEQINHATRTLLFRDINEPTNIQCPISQENFNPEDEVTQITHCGHIFCKNSISRWFTTSVHCPVCRYDIRTNTESTSSAATEPITNPAAREPTPNSTTREPGNSAARESENNINNILNNVLSEFNNSTNDPAINNILTLAEQFTNRDNNTSGFDIFYTIQR